MSDPSPANAPASGGLAFARQAILDREQELFGYELLFRGDAAGDRCPDRPGGDAATSRVLLCTLGELGLEAVVGNSLAFINLTRAFFEEPDLLPAPASRLMLEVLEDIESDAALLAGIDRLRERGYRIALDDFVYRPGLEPLVERADVVKLDLRALGMNGLAEQCSALRPFGVPLLAEKVETMEEFEASRALSVSYFQGYFFSRPQIVEGQSITPGRLNVLRLLGALQDPDSQPDHLAAVIQQDAALSYRLLRYINSAWFGLGREVDSIRKAVILLGAQPLRSWASLLALAQIDDKPGELMRSALIRARLLEHLCETRGLDAASGFLVGLFSLLDALLDQPMPVLMEHLPLATELRRALVAREGAYGDLLAAVEAHERADWERVGALGADPDTLTGHLLEAVRWSDGVLASLP